MKKIEKLILEKMKEIVDVLVANDDSPRLSMFIIRRDDGVVYISANNEYWQGGANEETPINFYYREGVDDEF